MVPKKARKSHNREYLDPLFLLLWQACGLGVLGSGLFFWGGFAFRVCGCKGLRFNKGFSEGFGVLGIGGSTGLMIRPSLAPRNTFNIKTAHENASLEESWQKGLVECPVQGLRVWSQRFSSGQSFLRGFMF